MLDNSVFRMSSATACPKILVAEKLGYEPKQKTRSDLDRLQYYSWLEDVAAKQIASLGYEVLDAGLCPLCTNPDGGQRSGFHVGLNFPLFSLVGHVDRQVRIDGKTYPVEIKSLGRFSWQRFKNNQFESFHDYEGQELCYLEYYKTPGIYWVLNRDTGDSLKYIVNDHKNILNLPGFEKIFLAKTFAEIEEQITSVVIDASCGELPNAPFEPDGKCRYCDYQYLCLDQVETDVNKTSEINIPELSEAARLYQEGVRMEKEGAERKSSAISTLLGFAKSNQPKFKISGVSFSYSGQKTRTTCDMDLLKTMIDDDTYNKVIRVGRPYDSYTVRVVKDENGGAE